jgi:hypothetical protein
MFFRAVRNYNFLVSIIGNFFHLRTIGAPMVAVEEIAKSLQATQARRKAPIL